MSESFAEQYTAAYRAQLAKAVDESAALGFKRRPLVSFQADVNDEALEAALERISAMMGMLDRILPGYWGNYCQALSTHIFAHLNHTGIPAELVIGNVIMQGNDEYEATLEGLRAEFNSVAPLTGGQRLHAWVSIGGDSIIDAAITPRLVKHYRAPERLANEFLVNRAVVMHKGYGLDYRPLLVGGEFFGKTNPPDPMDLLNELNRRQSECR